MGFHSGPTDGLFLFERERLRRASDRQALRAALLALGPVLVVSALALDPRQWLPPALDRHGWMAAVGVAAASVSLAGLPRTGSWASRAIFGLGAAVFLGIASFGLPTSASRSVVFLLVVAALLLRVAATFRRIGAPTDEEAESLVHPRALGAASTEASFGALLAWFISEATGLAPGDEAHFATLAGFGVAFATTTRWVIATWPRTPTADRRWLGLLVPLPVLALTQVGDLDRVLFFLALQQVLAVALLRWFRSEGGDVLELIADHPARVPAASFALLSVFGGVALSLPVASRAAPISVADAFFTAVSAACVSGFPLLDPATDLSFVGQAILLGLVQAGGLGVMAFSAGVALLVGRRLGVREERAVAGLLGDDGASATRAILGVTAATEGLGAAVLSAWFVARGVPWPEALWQGVFASVSAFCGAGLLTSPGGMAAFRDDPVVLHTMAALVVVGSLGVPAVLAASAWARGRAISLQSRLILVTTAVLLLVSAPLFAAFEWSDGLGGLSPWMKLNNAWFAVVTPRSAGFAAIDPATYSPPGVLLTLVLMFIGGSPASTGGGVKTTTIALLWLAVMAALKGRSTATAYSRTIAHASVYRAVAIMTLYTILGAVGVVGLLLTQPHVAFLGATFEVTSALGTVGLSLGDTAGLDDVGRAILVVLMFVGRVGPLSLFLLLNERQRPSKWAFPEETVTVG